MGCICIKISLIVYNGTLLYILLEYGMDAFCDNRTSLLAIKSIIGTEVWQQLMTLAQERYLCCSDDTVRWSEVVVSFHNIP